MRAQLRIGLSAWVLVELVGLVTACDGDAGSGITPAISAEPNQKLSNPRQVVIQSVTSDGPGWIVVLESSDTDQAGEVLGALWVPSGTTPNQTVSIGRDAKDGELLWARVHRDSGKPAGEFEPNLDVVFKIAGRVVEQSFVVAVKPTPMLKVGNQTLSVPREVSITEVVSVGKGFVVVHEPDPADATKYLLLGAAAVNDGKSTDVKVSLSRDVKDGETLHAMLHQDLNGDGLYDARRDVSVTVDGVEVVEPFVVTYKGPPTPQIMAEDQELADPGEVTIKQVKSAGNCLVLIHEDAGGKPSTKVIGQESVPTGESNDVKVGLEPDAREGETLHAMLHVDSNGNGQYDGESDPPVLVAKAEVTGSFKVTLKPSLAAPAYTATSVSSQVSVGPVVSPGAGFLVVHSNTAGAPGPVIGWATVVAGKTESLMIELDRPLADSQTVWPMLHKDTNPGDGDYKGEVADPPVLDAGKAVTVAMKVVVPEGTPAASITLDDTDPQWVVESVTPAKWETGMVDQTAGNSPTLTLAPGWRYEVVTPKGHPLAFGSDDAEFVNALVQGSTDGKLETDGDINWDDMGDGKARFTVSATFQAAVNAYRCNTDKEKKGKIAFILE
jgi:hypothetical protein